MTCVIPPAKRNVLTSLIHAFPCKQGCDTQSVLSLKSSLMSEKLKSEEIIMKVTITDATYVGNELSDVFSY